MQGPVGFTEVVTIPPGAQPGQRRIVIDGTRGAIFEYNTPGNTLVSSWAASAGTDQFGNAYPQGFNIGPGSVFSGLEFIINSNGLYFYSGTPALGNLVASITSVAGTDPSGNATLPQVTGYQNVGGSTYLALSIDGAGLQFFVSINGEGGPWHSEGSILPSMTSFPGLTGPFWSITSPLLMYFVLHGIVVPINATALIELAAVNAGDVTLALEVHTDTVSRLTIDSNGKMSWSTGVAAADTDLYRSTDPTSSVPVLKTDNEFNPASLNVPANTGAHLGVDGNGLLYLIGTAPATGIRALAQLNGDAIQRWQIDANGKMSWGDGTHAVDTDLYRDAGGSRLVTDVAFLAIAAIETEADFIVFQGGSTNIAFVVQAIGQPNPQFLIDCNGKHLWGVGGGTATDTDLFRQAAGTLATDSILSLKNAGSAPPAISGYQEIVGSGANLPFTTAASGQGWFLSGSSQADFTQTTVVSVALQACGHAWQINLNDASIGDTYEFDLQIIGKQGSTVQSLTVGWLLAGTSIGSLSFPASFAGASAAFLAQITLTVDIQNNGSGGACYWGIKGLASAAGGIQTPAGGGPTTVATTPFNTTVNNSVQFNAGWSSTTGAPTMTTIVSRMRKVA